MEEARQGRSKREKDGGRAGAKEGRRTNDESRQSHRKVLVRLQNDASRVENSKDI